jgi:hypothetical protein
LRRKSSAQAVDASLDVEHPIDAVGKDATEDRADPRHAAKESHGTPLSSLISGEIFCRRTARPPTLSVSSRSAALPATSTRRSLRGGISSKPLQVWFYGEWIATGKRPPLVERWI